MVGCLALGRQPIATSSEGSTSCCACLRALLSWRHCHQGDCSTWQDEGDLEGEYDGGSVPDGPIRVLPRHPKIRDPFEPRWAPPACPVRPEVTCQSFGFMAQHTAALQWTDGPKLGRLGGIRKGVVAA